MNGLSHDLRFSMRMLSHAPGTAAVIIVTLALAIGANTVVFSLVDELLLRPLRVPNAEDLVTITSSGGVDGGISYRDYLDYQEQSHTLSGLLAYAPGSIGLSSGDTTELVSACFSSLNYFEVLGVRPQLGRAFQAGRSEAAGEQVTEVVVSHALWQSRFAGDPAIVGRDVRINGASFVVVGVTPKTFDNPLRGFAPDLWIPLTTQSASLKSRAARGFVALGRLKRDVSVEAAQAEMTVIALRLGAEYPETNRDVRLTLRPERGALVAAHQEIALFVRALFALVGVTLLIACANVTHVLLARGVFRRKEMAIRLALGAGRPRLVQQLLTESVVLALLGGVAGVLVAIVAGSVLWNSISTFVNVRGLSINTSLDVRMLVFSLSLSVLAALVAGVSPALMSSAVDVYGSLKDRPAVSRRVSGLRLDSFLIASQVALSILLLVSAGFFIRTLGRTWRMDLGYPLDGVSLASIDFKTAGYDAVQAVPLADELVRRIRAMPGVDAVAAARGTAADEGWPVFLPPSAGRGERLHLVVGFIGPKYFETLRIPLLAGREFTQLDERARPVAIMSQSAALRVWSEPNPVGRQLKVWADMPPVEIVGVVPDVKSRPMLFPRTRIYFPLAQQPQTKITLHVRSDRSLAAVAGLIQKEVGALGPLVPSMRVFTLRDRMNEGYSLLRLGMSVLASLGGFSLLLAGIGIYGLTMQFVGARVREIGVRRALGADRLSILWFVFGRAIRPLALGLGVGLLLSLGASQVIASLVRGSSLDPLVFLGAPGILVAACFAAAYLPARRAIGVEPFEALRSE